MIIIIIDDLTQLQWIYKLFLTAPYYQPRLCQT